MASYIFIPWPRGPQAQEFINKSAQWNEVKQRETRAQLRWDLDNAEGDPRWNQEKFIVVCYQDPVTFANLGAGDQIIVRGHGKEDTCVIVANDRGFHPLNVDDVCDRLAKQGLDNFQGRIKFYNCESGQPGKVYNINIARAAAAILKKKNPNCRIYGYKESVSSYYEEDPKKKGEWHKWGRASGKRAGDPSVREQVYP